MELEQPSGSTSSEYCVTPSFSSKSVCLSLLPSPSTHLSVVDEHFAVILEGVLRLRPVVGAVGEVEADDDARGLLLEDELPEGLRRRGQRRLRVSQGRDKDSPA